MNSKSFDSFIKEHYPKNNHLEMSDETLNRIMQLNTHSSCTKVAKRIIIARLLLLLFIALLIPTTVYAATTLYDVVYKKVKNANLTKEEISNLTNELSEQEFSADDIDAVAPLERNENGQTYGVDMFSADLIAVELDDGTQGYVYREELYPDDVSTPEEAVKHTQSNKTRRLKVYESDGKTVIGYFTVGGE